jgi:diacylglycerol O-acyltransferase
MVIEASWGGPAAMSAWEALMWRAEADPRTRSTGILLELLDGEPSWEDVRALMEKAVEQVPRLRDRVVLPPVTVLQPFWSPDPDFDLDDHISHHRLEGRVDLRGVLDACERLLHTPIDRRRAPWEARLLTGLDGGRSAFVLKVHHSLSDGQGLMQLLELLHGGGIGLRSDDASGPVTGRGAADALVRKAGADLAHLPAAAARGAVRGLAAVAQAATRPRAEASRAVDFAASLGRMLAPLPLDRSPLLSGGGVGSSFLALDVPLADLKRAGRAGGGSVNDAFVAAALGGLRRYHEHHGVRRDRVPVSMPVSLRREGDPSGGNRFAGVRFAGPMSETDPAARIKDIGRQVDALRREPALGFLDYLAPPLTKLPTSAIVELSVNLTSSVDLQISNIRGLAEPIDLAGVPVTGTYPLGPRPGVAAMVAMITYAGTCCIGVNADPHVVADPEVLETCLRAGFDEVLALAEGAPHPRHEDGTIR